MYPRVVEHLHYAKESGKLALVKFALGSANTYRTHERQLAEQLLAELDFKHPVHSRYPQPSVHFD
jgi:hypothetical protein